MLFNFFCNFKKYDGTIKEENYTKNALLDDSSNDDFKTLEKVIDNVLIIGILVVIPIAFFVNLATGKSNFYDKDSEEFILTSSILFAGVTISLFILIVNLISIFFKKKEPTFDILNYPMLFFSVIAYFTFSYIIIYGVDNFLSPFIYQLLILFFATIFGFFDSKTSCKSFSIIYLAIIIIFSVFLLLTTLHSDFVKNINVSIIIYMSIISLYMYILYLAIYLNHRVANYFKRYEYSTVRASMEKNPEAVRHLDDIKYKDANINDIDSF